MRMKLCATVCFAMACSYLIADEEEEMIRVPGEGKVVFFASKQVDAAVVRSAASKVSNILLVEFESRSGEWTMKDAKETMTGAGAAAAVFVVKEKDFPLSIVAMEGKWGVVNADGLSPKGVEKEILRVAAVVLGAASSRYPASALRPVFSVAELEKDAGGVLAIDSIMAIFPNLEAYGFRQFQLLDYAAALYDGVAPPPKNEKQRQIKAEYERTKKAAKK